MSTINIFKKTFRSLSSNGFKNAIIIFGFCVSIITITSYDSISNNGPSDLAMIVDTQHMPDVSSMACEQENENVILRKEHKVSNRHNFIASYLLQESSHKRERNSSDEGRNFFSNLRHLHETILVNFASMF